MILPVESTPLKSPQPKILPCSKSPGNKIKDPMGVEPLFLLMLGSKSTSRSHNSKNRTTEGVEQTTDKTGGIILPTGTDNTSTVISRK